MAYIFFDTGQVENVEFHKLSGLDEEILIIQGAINQGHGNTFVFRILDNRPECIGYVRRSIDRNWGKPLNATEIELYAGRGNLQVAFQDIDNDGYEEMLVYGRKPIYEVEPKDEEELREVFVDEYWHYTLVDEEPYLTLHRYNSYGCRIEDDMLYMYGSRLILDGNGNVCGVDKQASFNM